MATVKPAPRLAELLKKRNPDEAINVKEHLRRYKVNGDFSVGVELELENVDGYLNRGVIDLNLWEEHRDGSLRGSSTELVTRFPIKGDNLLAALDNVYEAAGNSMEAMKSLRTSTHIHVNALDMSVEAVCIFMLAACFAEPYFLEISDQYRKYCGYCLPSKSPIANAVASFLHNRKLGIQAESRYYGVNILALEKYGTIEFRHFSTPHTLDDAIKIVNLCTDLKKLALELENTPKFLTKQGLPGALTSIRGAVSQLLQSDNLVPVKELELEIALKSLKDERFISIDGKEEPKKSYYPYDELLANRRPGTVRVVGNISAETLSWPSTPSDTANQTVQATTFRRNITSDLAANTTVIGGLRVPRSIADAMISAIQIQRNAGNRVLPHVEIFIDSIESTTETAAFVHLIRTSISEVRNLEGVQLLRQAVEMRAERLMRNLEARFQDTAPPNF